MTRMDALIADLGGLMNEDINVVLAGDLNQPEIDWLNWSSPSRRSDDSDGTDRLSKEEKFLHFCSESGLQQFVDKPTRGHNLLDLVLAKDDSIEDIVVSNAPITTDHLLITFCLAPYPVNSPAESTFRNYNKGDYDGIIVNLMSTDWQTFF